MRLRTTFTFAGLAAAPLALAFWTAPVPAAGPKLTVRNVGDVVVQPVRADEDAVLEIERLGRAETAPGTQSRAGIPMRLILPDPATPPSAIGKQLRVRTLPEA